MKRIEYPFEPKSNRYLLPGQFWAIPLDSGRYACGRVLDVPPPEQKNRNTKLFLAGLMDWVGEALPSTASLRGSKVLDQGDAHIKTILHTGKYILGYRSLEADGIVIRFEVTSKYYSSGSYLMQGYKEIRLSTHEDYEKYQAHSTWGFMVIKRLAEKYFGTKPNTRS